eukprot:3458532-Pleurochrysis_carterae.AAC.1
MVVPSAAAVLVLVKLTPAPRRMHFQITTTRAARAHLVRRRRREMRLRCRRQWPCATLHSPLHLRATRPRTLKAAARRPIP